VRVGVERFECGVIGEALFMDATDAIVDVWGLGADGVEEIFGEADRDPIC
jgi:hypothetical protein